MAYCVICKNKDTTVTKFRFPNPKHPARHEVFKQWLVFANKEKLNKMSWNDIYKKTFVCRLHFNEEDLNEGFSRKTLKWNAVPTQNREIATVPIIDIHNDNLPSDTHNVNLPSRLLKRSLSYDTKSKTNISPNKCVVYKRAFPQQSRIIKRKSFQLRKKIKAATKLNNSKVFQKHITGLAESASLFIRSKVKKAEKIKTNKRFSLDEKLLCLKLYKQSGPKAYQTLSVIFNIPSRSAMFNLLKQIPISAGINQIMVNYLSSIVSKLHPLDKNCSIIFGDIFLTPKLKYNSSNRDITGFEDFGNDTKTKNFADRSLVFMIRGLRKNYNVPFAYYFYQTNMKSLDLIRIIKEIVTSVTSTGLKIRALVCNQSNKNIVAIKKLKNETRDYLLQNNRNNNEDFLIINDIKIYSFFDPPDLIKSIRNNLLNNDLEFDIQGVGVAKWQHVMEMYCYDRKIKEKEFYGVPKLTDSHINPQKIKKTKVKYATQVFSQRAASYMYILSDAKFISSEAKETCKVLLYFDDLFDSVNSSKKFIEGKPLRSAVSKKSIHSTFWQQSITVLKKMKFSNTKASLSLQNWKSTLISFIKLNKELQKEGFDYFFTRRVNLDPLDKFFAKRNFSTNPTPYEFIDTFKILVLNNISSKYSLSANSEDDKQTDGFKRLKKFIKTSKTRPNAKNTFEVGVLNMASSKNLLYVAKYFLRKLKFIYASCSICKSILSTNVVSPEFRKYLSLEYPSKVLLHILEKCKNLVLNLLPIHCNINLNIICNLVYVDNIFYFFKCNSHTKQLRECFSKLLTDLITYTWVKDVNKFLTGRQLTDPNDPIKENAANFYIFL